MRPSWPCALALACVSASAGTLREPRSLAPPRVAPVAAPAALPTSCLACDTLYGVDPGGNFWTIDPVAGTATWIGNLPFPTMLDIGISADGDMYGLAEDELKLIDTCSDPFASVQVALMGGNALGGALSGPKLFVGGPPLSVYDIAADTVSFRGGAIGSDPPDWCGGTSGDMAMNPADGLLYATLSCPECAGGDMLVTIDPASGNALSEIGCILDASGAPVPALWGLAFDAQCRLVASPGFGPFVAIVDPASAGATIVPITGFSSFGDPFNGAWGLASYPCGPCGAATAACDPKVHGWWHRECLGADLVDPGRRGGGRGPGPSPRAASYPASAFPMADADMAPHGERACQALDEGPMSDPRLAALRELATIHLNIRAGFLDRSCPVELRPVVDAPGLTVGHAIGEMESRLLSGTDDDLRDARWIGEHVVNGEALR